jgi:hypothetical protein
MSAPESPSSRREFLRLAALAGFGLGIGNGLTSNLEAAPDPRALSFSGITEIGKTRPRPAGAKPVWNLATKPMEKVRVAFIGLARGMTHLDSALNLPFAEVIAVCDLLQDRAENAAKKVANKTGKRPAVYAGDENIWEKMIARDDIDVVYISTPWEWHVPMCVKSMKAGKHAFVEVSAAVTVDECWQLVDTSELTQRHCVILENCCYGDTELFVLNMARQGFFGEMKHAECAYIHDLRQEQMYRLGAEGAWRRNYHTFIDGNLYPTHGLGPVAQYMGINRGDAFKYVVSMSSPEFNLTQFRDKNNPNGGRHKDEKYICGDMNTSLIKTELGRSIMIQHDVVSPRPYSRINALCGTKATFFDYPPRLAVDGKGHGWAYEGEKLKVFMQENAHPLWKKVGELAKRVGGHGGMDFIMNYRLLDCVRQGITPDMTVYDAADWSCILEISACSVKNGSMPVQCPDFTRGGWKSLAPLPVVS